METLAGTPLLPRIGAFTPTKLAVGQVLAVGSELGRATSILC
jgi:hypothetical protein